MILKRAFAIFIVLSALVSGCGSLKDSVKVLEGTSIKNVEDARKNALAKVFNYDYDTCYAKIEKFLQGMPNTAIYAKTEDMIASYYIDPNTTPVGVFFKVIDPTHTEVAVSSPSSPTKEYVAKAVFSETLPAASGSSLIRTRKGSTYSQSVMK